MGSSAKPRRRRAAAPVLQYERHRGRPNSARTTENRRGQYTFGCLIALVITGALLVIATLDWLRGDDTWQWAAETWPGGAYAFAVCVGVIGPCLITLSLFSLSNVNLKSWKQHRTCSLTYMALGVVSTASLMPYVALVFNAQDTGKWGRGRSTPPSWVFGHYPWLWAVGLLSTVATVGLLIWFFIARSRRRDPAESVVP
jgi:hypothetical protein